MDTLVKYLYDMGFKGWAIALAILLMFIEFSPKIKWNPITSIVRWFGARFNSSVNKQIKDFKDNVNSKIHQLETENTTLKSNLQQVSIDFKTFKLNVLFWDVSRFETSVMNGEKFYREQYRKMIDDENKYKDLAAELNLSNEEAKLSEFEESIETIKHHYDEHRSDRDMLI